MLQNAVVLENKNKYTAHIQLIYSSHIVV